MLDLRPIEELMRNDTFVFRVHDEDSFTHYSPEHGFSKLSPGQDVISWNWEVLNNTGSAGYIPAVKEIVDHVRGGWGYDRTMNDDPWISTSGNLHRPIWEVARRLKEGRVEEVRLSIITRYNDWTNTVLDPGCYDLSKENFQADASHELHYTRFQYEGHYPNQSALKQAHAFARASSEILFLSQIPQVRILETLTFTQQSVPCVLLREWFRGPTFKPRRWMDHLVWTPGVDSFRQARKRIVKNRETF